MRGKIKVYKRWYLSRHYCDQCMKRLHKLWVRETPRTTRHYCEGCAIENKVIPQ